VQLSMLLVRFSALLQLPLGRSKAAMEYDPGESMERFDGQCSQHPQKQDMGLFHGVHHVPSVYGVPQ
jgi:hypothetical protein